MKGIIVNLAPTGIIPSRATSPHVPLTVAEIVADVKRCALLGANMVHLHARDEAGMPSYRQEIYARLIGEIRNCCPELILCVSLSGRVFSDFEQRIDPLLLKGDLKPDMASLTLASMNFSRSASVNEPATIQRLAQFMLEADIKPELEVFDTGMVNYAVYLLERGLLKPPLYFNVILGNIATGQAKLGTLNAILNELPAGSIWAGGGIGEHQLRMNALGILFGNGVRTGLEDALWLNAERTHPAKNSELVARAIEMAHSFGQGVATPGEVRSALNLCP
ncbi:MAG: 3-keto-5-aminohexanoate cleavage protein [Desulfobacterales bacterium]|nr:3-keto-5-aminohexanoate cleavage protein [Desulfobacterales bacterium]